MAHALELDVSSCGANKEKALRNLKEAVRPIASPKFVGVRRVTLPLPLTHAKALPGDHMVFTEARREAVVVPKYEFPVFIIKSNLPAAGISRDRYFELLGQYAGFTGDSPALVSFF